MAECALFDCRPFRSSGAALGCNPRLATTTAGNEMPKMKSLPTKTGLVLVKILMGSSVA